jgi:uncharacterized protein with ParB-like and HNH nuclease domain
MNANKQKLVDDLIASDRRQYKIPIYQRKYKWTNEQCNRLIKDMLAASKLKKEHFTGTIVVQDGRRDSSVFKFFLVDGQQRMTTIMLIIKALELIAIEKPNDKDYEYVLNNTRKFIYADQNDKTRGLKVVLSKNDKLAFDVIMSGTSMQSIESSPLVPKHQEDYLINNFKLIYESLVLEIQNGHNIRENIFQGLLSLTVVLMTLDPGDDAQEIFESINSLGVRLTNADLIRNYLLMSNEHQDILFEQYWEPIEKLIGESNMEEFVKNYLLTKKSFSIKDDDIYKEYVSYSKSIETVQLGREQLFQDLLDNATIFQPFIKKTEGLSEQTNQLMQELREIRQTTTYPFLMRVFLDKQQGIVDEYTLNKVINLIIVYLVRRTICGVPTSSLRSFMLPLYNRVFGKVESNKKQYYESIYTFLTTLNSKDSLQDTEEVLKHIHSFPFYDNPSFATYILYRLENGRFPNASAEYVAAKSVSVEHIMPQNLNEDWLEELGENAETTHQNYLNTLGNLSLSSGQKNSSLSDKPFREKKEILFGENSKFDQLNKSIKTFEKFTDKEILQRSSELARMLMKRYELPEVKVQGIRFDDVEELICSADSKENLVFKHTKPISFKLQGEEIFVDTFSSILVKVTRLLLKKYPEKIRELAAKGYSLWNGDKKLLLYSTDESFEHIGEGIKITTGLSATDNVDFVADLLQECGLESQELAIVVKKDSIKRTIDKSKFVRNALKVLSKEGLIIYEPEQMPKSNRAIKFKTELLDKTFNTMDYDTKWDGEKFKEIAFCEVFINKEYISISFKNISKSKIMVEKLINLQEEFSLENPTKGDYWHLIKIPFQIKTIAEQKEPELVLIDEIRKAVKEINSKLELIISKTVQK